MLIEINIQQPQPEAQNLQNTPKAIIPKIHSETQPQQNLIPTSKIDTEAQLQNPPRQAQNDITPKSQLLVQPLKNPP